MKVKQMKTILGIVILLTGVLYGNQTSLECTKVKRGSCEALVCNSDELIELDVKLVIAYKKATNKTSKENLLQSKQRDWTKSRNECWKVQDVDKYLIDIYHTRIKELKEQYYSSNI
jgi:uncharacterized protein